MIPPRDQDFLRQRFQRELTNRLRIDLFVQKPSPIYVPGRQDCLYCDDVRGLMEELASLSSRIVLTIHDFDQDQAAAADLGVDKVPAVVLRGPTNRPVRLFGLFSGSQFPSLIEVLLDVARGVMPQPETQRRLRRLKDDVRLQVLVTTTCPHCPPVVRAAVRLALQSVRIKLDVIEVVEFPALGQGYGVQAVPATLIGDRLMLVGALDEAALLDTVLHVAEGKAIAGVIQAAATPLDPAVFQRQPATNQVQVTSPGGLILPR
jgi:glutaredoxin-like protein